LRAAFFLIFLSVATTLVALSQTEAADELVVATLAIGTRTNADVERIKAGEINCRGCNLSGADLSHTCVKNGDLRGADFAGTTARYMCMSYANFTDVSFRGANLTGANLAHANLTNADMSGAILNITSFKGTDLRRVKGLTQRQIDDACSDEHTRLPAGLKPNFCS
jgi:uncharacterized protein YjbI with pentapeptide repeats